MLAACLLASSCGGGADARRVERAEIEVEELDDVLLRADEGPPETEYVPERSGTVVVQDLWPSDCCPTQQLEFEEAGFRSAYARVFLKPGHSGDPIDTRPGWELVSSAAVLFASEAGASEAMDSWLSYYESPVLEALSTEGLGDEAVAVTGSPNAPAEVFFLYLWRVGRALLALRVSAGTGTVSGDQVRDLVDRMDSRIR